MKFGRYEGCPRSAPEKLPPDSFLPSNSEKLQNGYYTHNSKDPRRRIFVCNIFDSMRIKQAF